MSNEPYRAGLLLSDKSFRNGQIVLPPEHRIAATREVYGGEKVEWLIEGPLMPEVPVSGRMLSVTLALSVKHEAGRVQIFGHWLHGVDREWMIGDWPTVVDFRRALGDTFAP